MILALFLSAWTFGPYGMRFGPPSAFVHTGPTVAPKVGDAVWVPHDDFVAGIGRVTAIAGSNVIVTYTVRRSDVGYVEGAVFPRAKVLVIPKRVAFGALVVVQDRWNIVYRADRSRAWVWLEGEEPSPVPLADVRVIDPTRRWRPGDAVLSFDLSAHERNSGIVERDVDDAAGILYWVREGGISLRQRWFYELASR